MLKNWLIAGALAVFSTSAMAPYWERDLNKSPIVQYVAKSNPKITNKSAREIVVAAQKWGYEHGVDSTLLLAIMSVESNFYPHAISASGAYGLMQVIPVWHKDKIVKARKELGNPEIFNINTNIYLGSLVLKDCMNKVKRVSKALSCYSGNTPGYDEKVLKQYVILKTALKIPT